MLRYLNKVLQDFENILNNTEWQSKYIDYHPPLVERLWCQDGDNRIYLHRIHSCEQPMRHTHGWPSAIYIVSGIYEMRVGHTVMNLATNKDEYLGDTKIILESTCRYEMNDSYTWHSVRPLSSSSLSIMVTGPPFKDDPIQEAKNPKNFRSLTSEEVQSILSDFRANIDSVTFVKPRGVK